MVTTQPQQSLSPTELPRPMTAPWPIRWGPSSPGRFGDLGTHDLPIVVGMIDQHTALALPLSSWRSDLVSTS